MATASNRYTGGIKHAAQPPPGLRAIRSPEEVVTVLAISPFPSDHEALRSIFGHSRWRLQPAESYTEALPALRGSAPPVVLCDEEIPDGTWQRVLNDLARAQVPPSLIVTSRLADDSLWAEVLNLGGYDVLMKPFDIAEVVRVIGLAWRNQMEKRLPKTVVAGA